MHSLDVTQHQDSSAAARKLPGKHWSAIRNPFRHSGKYHHVHFRTSIWNPLSSGPLNGLWLPCMIGAAPMRASTSWGRSYSASRAVLLSGCRQPKTLYYSIQSVRAIKVECGQLVSFINHNFLLQETLDGRKRKIPGSPFGWHSQRLLKHVGLLSW